MPTGRENHLGQFIRSQREALALTQDELGEMIHAPRGYVSQIETGTKKWPRSYIPALAKALRVSEDELKQQAGRAPMATQAAMLSGVADGLVGAIEFSLHSIAATSTDASGAAYRAHMAQLLTMIIDIFTGPEMDETMLIRAGLREPIATLATTYPDPFGPVIIAFDALMQEDGDKGA